MRIAHIVCTYPPYYGGMGNVVFQTAQGLISKGHDVEVYTPQYSEPEDEDIEHVERLAPSFSYGNAARMPQLLQLLDSFDLVHLHYPFFGSANIVRRWKLRNPDVPLVVTYHMDNRGSGWKGLVFDVYRRFWLPRICACADLLIGSSFDFIRASDAQIHYAQHPKKWIDLPFGVDIERFTPRKKPESLFSKYGYDPTVPTVLFVGGMDMAHYFKDVPTLIRAMGFLKRANIHVQTILVGEGNLRSEYEAMVAVSGLRERMRFADSVSDEELPYYYNMADLLVLPSMNQAEAFGMVLLEAYASGVPVIATDLPGVRSVASDAGFVMPIADPQTLAAIIEQYVKQGEGNIHAWRQKARSVAQEKYAWGPIIDKLEQLYLQLAHEMRV